MANKPAKSSRARLVVPLLVVAIAAALVAVVLIMQEGKKDATPPPSLGEIEIVDSDDAVVEEEAVQPPPPPDQDLTVLETREADDPLAIGELDAPVGMVVFSDYQCPYCGRWNEDTLPAMLEYVDQGLLRIEWRDANLFGEPSVEAARAAYAAGLQGKFLEFNNALFPNGGTLSDSALTSEALIKLAGELGLDQAQFEADLTSAETAQIVDEHAAFARGVGVTSTPTFALGGAPIVGAQPTQVFIDAFEDALAKHDG